MAWTKMKTAAIAGAVILLTVGTGVVAVKSVHAVRGAGYPDIQGAWEGVLDTVAQAFKKGDNQDACGGQDFQKERLLLHNRRHH